MPFKYHQSRRYHIKKRATHTQDWKSYNQSLKRCGNMTIWLLQECLGQWYEKDRIYNGTGTPNLYSDMAIFTVHEIRQVFKLPLRQCEGFINSLFKLMNIDLHCPSYTKQAFVSTNPYYKENILV